MTSPDTLDLPLADALPADVSPAVDAPVANPEKAAIPAFRFPFSPATYAPNKNAGQAWHQKGSNASHEKKIGPAPSGTRRSMGKR
ncbi:hypothetical protein IB229_17600 [Pseudomonas sp. PDM14]|uniref:hypothetical protein n=1 Tax=Pseudomonas sp. PDM14 TaxID=2769288 RepID=UPI00178636EE|nr:hypothetical protein [Pseudomonas sp. PDM14]MBD9484801.1 hypothetical protein [Pseudomonas sp. PDM14]